MAIFLPGTAEDQALGLDEMTPREIVAELDKYVVGQAAAKRAVAIALRNRTRRQKLPPDLAEEIMPKNILMIGSTGVGKTEIARRLAKLTNSPFLKVEASKFTEVGYVGRDVESIVRDLMEIAIDMVREEKLDDVEDRAELLAEERLIELLIAQGTASSEPAPVASSQPPEPTDDPPDAPRDEAAPTLTIVAKSDADGMRERERLLQQFREGKLDDRMVELETRERAVPQVEVLSNSPEDMEQSGIKEMIAGMFGQRTRKRPMKVADAFEYLSQEEESRLLDMDQVVRIAVERVEDSGIVFLDEIDKIAGREGGHGPDISREGVQRDILPIVEGTTVSTKYGMVTTDHILFIAAGAFHVSKPSDLIPELQGRFPIRVELLPLTVDDFLRILTEPRASLVKQAIALLETEGLKLEFATEALEEMARFAFQVNETTENIGARRLHTIMEKVLDEISFEAPDIVKAGSGAISDKVPALIDRLVPTPSGEPQHERVLIVDRAYVEKQVASIVKNQDLSRYIL
ncbi:ATP-dependent protease ATPase subunit HslU [Granulicella sp. L46]|uniref:ATP-dependent protease ATPase subunit HslU n=1 Tax=Granulicella sp. L46 TaxID=1641865 RepID=UPI00131B777E|nr:ATP-dependent protease ATPase subunit HslU [Granulicella sp. L46]